MAPGEFVKIRLVVRGRVQGVGFRRFVYRQAESLGIGGWVRNNPDSSVEVEAYGENSTLQLFMREVHKGPFFARVDEIEELQKEPVTHLPDLYFVIK